MGASRLHYKSYCTLIFHEMHACNSSARMFFIGEQSVAGADAQPGGQVENRFTGMPGVRKKRIFESQNLKSNANPLNEYSNNQIFWSSPTVERNYFSRTPSLTHSHTHTHARNPCYSRAPQACACGMNNRLSYKKTFNLPYKTSSPSQSKNKALVLLQYSKWHCAL